MWKDWLALSKREQKGFIVLSVILVLLIIFYLLIPLIFSTGEQSRDGNDEALKDWVDSVNAIKSKHVVSQQDSFFFFDPNEISKSKLQKLGVNGYALINWLKFRDSGNEFTKPEDILRIYSIDSALAYKLIPYIRFSSMSAKSRKQSGKYHKQTEGVRDIKRGEDPGIIKQRVTYQHDDLFVIEINRADTAEFAVLKGIGPVLSLRIVLYRQVLGGFYDIEQLKEVYGMPPNTINNNRKYLSVDSLVISKINVNKVTLRQLKNHPYIDFYLAKAIIEYRKKNDSIKSINEILSFKEVKPEMKNKLAVYLSVEQNEKKKK